MMLPAAQQEAIDKLLDECGRAVYPDVRQYHRHVRRHEPVCAHCGQPGKMGGHHRADGSVVYVHRSCHRKLHNAPDMRTA